MVFLFLEEGISFSEGVLGGIRGGIGGDFRDGWGEYGVVDVWGWSNCAF